MVLVSQLLLGGAAALAASTARAHPVEKVISLLEGLAATAEKEGKTEQVLYTKLEHWCAVSRKDLNNAIATEKAAVERLSEEIAGHETNIASLGKQIETLAADLLEQDQLGAEALRERTASNELYKEEKASLEQTSQAVADGIRVLTETRANTDTGLVQVRHRVKALLALVGFRATAQQRDTLQSFVEKPRPELKAAGDREKHVKGYGFKSDSVIELLKQLKLDFDDQLVAANQEETNAVNAYSLAKGARDNLITAKKQAKETKEREATDTKEDLASANAGLTSTRDDLAANTHTLSDAESRCRLTKSEWEERSRTRDLEIEAIHTAEDILAKATGVRTEAPANPIPPASPIALLQIDATAPLAEKALHILRQEAKKVHSQALGRIADDVDTRVKHGDGHFDQVVNSIEKMIFRLMNEQKQEDEHKNWCDQEISKTETSIGDKHQKVDELTIKIDLAQARAVKLRGEVKAADDLASDIGSHMQEATEIREVGKEENRLAIKDAEEAQTAIANAVAVLKDFYKSSGGMKKEAWEFLQGPVELRENPSTWDSGYTRVADPAAQPGGIVTVLEKVASDFAEMESQTRAQEEQDRVEYQSEMKNCKIEQARLREESKQKQAEAERTTEHQRSMETQRKSVAGELEATQQYMKDLHPACITGSSTYEDRKAAREGEIGAMKEAQELLNNAFEEKAVAPTPAPPASFLQRRLSVDQPH